MININIYVKSRSDRFVIATVHHSRELHFYSRSCIDKRSTLKDLGQRYGTLIALAERIRLPRQLYSSILIRSLLYII